MPTESRNTASVKRAARGNSPRVKERGDAVGEVPFIGCDSFVESGGIIEGIADRGQNSAAGLIEGGFQDGAGGQAMAAAAEALRQTRDIDAPGTEADFHAAARLLHEQQTNFDAGYASNVVDQILAVLRSGTGSGVIVAADLGVGYFAAVCHLRTRLN